MNIKLLTTAILVTALTGCNQQGAEGDKAAAKGADKSELATEQQRVSYGMGVNLGGRIKQEFDLDVQSFALGVGHAVDGTEKLMTDEQIQQELMAFQQKQVAKHEADQQAVAETNKTASAAFLAENAKKEGVVTTASGLQYKIVTAGTGAKPGAEETVEVHYRGTLIDGTEFDSSYKRNQSVSFPVNGVIAGWTEALQLMPVGSKWELYIPADLAYGAGGTGGPIGPNQALIFEVELLSIKSPADDAAAKPAHP